MTSFIKQQNSILQSWWRPATTRWTLMTWRKSSMTASRSASPAKVTMPWWALRKLNFPPVLHPVSRKSGCLEICQGSHWLNKQQTIKGYFWKPWQAQSNHTSSRVLMLHVKVYMSFNDFWARCWMDVYSPKRTLQESVCCRSWIFTERLWRLLLSCFQSLLWRLSALGRQELNPRAAPLTWSSLVPWDWSPWIQWGGHLCSNEHHFGLFERHNQSENEHTGQRFKRILNLSLASYSPLS